jgi:hypothetical protein
MFVNKKPFWVVGAIVALAGLAYGGKNVMDDPGWNTTTPVKEGLERSIAANRVSSPRVPLADIKVDDRFEYIGGHKFVLYGTANVEQHAFVLPNEKGEAQTALVIHFEEVMDGVEWQYDYHGSTNEILIDDLDFVWDTRPGTWNTPLLPQGWPGSDTYQMSRLLEEKGFRFPQTYRWGRAVHLPTEDRRSELLIIIYDDLEPLGRNGDQLKPDGEYADEWPQRSQELLDKLQNIVTITAKT